MLKVEIRPDWILRDARGTPVALPGYDGGTSGTLETLF
jgi:hypothetical protein